MSPTALLSHDTISKEKKTTLNILQRGGRVFGKLTSPAISTSWSPRCQSGDGLAPVAHACNRYTTPVVIFTSSNLIGRDGDRAPVGECYQSEQTRYIPARSLCRPRVWCSSSSFRVERCDVLRKRGILLQVLISVYGLYMYLSVITVFGRKHMYHQSSVIHVVTF